MLQLNLNANFRERLNLAFSLVTLTCEDLKSTLHYVAQCASNGEHKGAFLHPNRKTRNVSTRKVNTGAKQRKRAASVLGRQRQIRQLRSARSVS